MLLYLVAAAGLRILMQLELQLDPRLLVACATVALVANLALCWFVPRARQRRELWAQTGMCEHCGYDLRATSIRCPECGHAVPEELQRLRRLATKKPTLAAREPIIDAPSDGGASQ